MICSVDECQKAVDRQDLCFRHRISGVGFGFKGPVREGRKNWNQTASQWREESFGTSDEKELGKRGIERASNYTY